MNAEQEQTGRPRVRLLRLPLRLSVAWCGRSQMRPRAWYRWERHARGWWFFRWQVGPAGGWIQRRRAPSLDEGDALDPISAQPR